jgi:hypothetical protein
MMLATLAPTVVPAGSPVRRCRQHGSLTVTSVTSAIQARAALELVARYAHGPVSVGDLVLARVGATAIGVGSIRRDSLRGRSHVQWCITAPNVTPGTVRRAIEEFAAIT